MGDGEPEWGHTPSALPLRWGRAERVPLTAHRPSLRRPSETQRRQAWQRRRQTEIETARRQLAENVSTTTTVYK